MFGPSLWPPGLPPRKRGGLWRGGDVIGSVLRRPLEGGGLALHAGGDAVLWGTGEQVDRAISTGQLRGLPRFHLRPIDVVVYHGSRARPGFEEGFPLRCVQRLSRPHLATRRCGWRHNRSTRGASLPVLSY